MAKAKSTYHPETQLKLMILGLVRRVSKAHAEKSRKAGSFHEGGIV